MCGIVGYTGTKQSQKILLAGLSRLEYRGYDSCGVCVQSGTKGRLFVRKMPGKVKELAKILEAKPLSGTCGIAHNRWATHGEPNKINAHPHLDCGGRVALVHNGIIENFSVLKEELRAAGHKFVSQTDTEVIVHLIEDAYRSLPLEEAVRKALLRLKGSFAVAVVAEKDPGKIVGARLGSPLVAATSSIGSLLASDISALLDYTQDVLFLEDNEMAVCDPRGIKVVNLLSGSAVKRAPVRISWDISSAQKQGWPHFMLKEINEQPKVLGTMLGQRVSGRGKIHFEELKIPREKLAAVENVEIIACGTAYHAGLSGKYAMEKLCRLSVNADVSSEFRYRDPVIRPNTLAIAISQSGETADTLAAAREARSKGALVLAVCNVLGSTLVRESDGVIYTHAGPEIGVASTKAYTAQVSILYLLAMFLASLKNTLPQARINSLLGEFGKCPALQERVLSMQDGIKKLAGRHSHFGSFLFLGRNINYPLAMEGALKLKEISYIPAEGYAAGEMKHGPIALIDEYRAVVCITPESAVYEKMISNIQEIRSRRGRIIVIASEGDDKIKELTPEVVYIPKTDEFFSPIIAALPLQLLAYHIAVKRGCDVDQPRNLAKSVTVE